MFLYDKEDCKIVNMNAVHKIFPSKDGNAVSMLTENGVSKVREYENEAEAREAIAMLAEYIRMGKGEIFCFPDEETIRTRIGSRRPEKSRLVNGKKTKGHGGS